MRNYFISWIIQTYTFGFLGPIGKIPQRVSQDMTLKKSDGEVLVMLQLWRIWIAISWYHSQVHSGPEW